MTLVGLELNATCARAVQASLGEYPHAVPLDPPATDLAMYVSLEHARLQVGQAGLRLLRTRSHFVCGNFLAHLATATPRTWHAGRHHLDSSQALSLVWQKLAAACKQGTTLAATFPAYLSPASANLALELGLKQKLALAGSLPSLLAAAHAGYAEQSWIGSVVVVDIDDHALSIGLVRAIEDEAHLIAVQHFPKLGLRAWHDRLINALADSCVLQSRRDPRDIPEAEQALFEQIDPMLDACLTGRVMHVGIQAAQWYQNLLVEPARTGAICSQLVRQVVHGVQALCQNLCPDEHPSTILVTAAAGRLPDLTVRLRAYMERVSGAHAQRARSLTQLEDFGAELVQDSQGQIAGVSVLSAEAPARAAHALAAHFQRGELPAGHCEQTVPLPLPQPAEAGPARLNFQGQDYPLLGPSFVLGSQSGCHLQFDRGRFPEVDPRHCEILFDHRSYLLHNRSLAGTLINDAPVSGSTLLHPGDWIRLGMQGPAIRFLGHGGD